MCVCGGKIVLVKQCLTSVYDDKATMVFTSFYRMTSKTQLEYCMLKNVGPWGLKSVMGVQEDFN